MNRLRRYFSPGLLLFVVQGIGFLPSRLMAGNVAAASAAGETGKAPQLLVLGANFLVWAAVLAFLIFLFIAGSKLRRSRAKGFWVKMAFPEAMDRFHLSDPEKDTAEAILLNRKGISPQETLFSQSAFEKCIDQYIRDLLQTPLSPEQKQQAGLKIGAVRKKLGFHEVAKRNPLSSTRNIPVEQAGSIMAKNRFDLFADRAVVAENTEFSFALKYQALEPAKDLPEEGCCFVFARQEDAHYSVPIKVLRREAAGLIESAHTLELERIQYRHFQRARIDLQVRFTLLETDPGQPSAVPLNTTLEGRMRDFGGGGLSFVFEKPLRMKDRVKVEFVTPDRTAVSAEALILGVNRLKKGLSLAFHHKAQFVDLPASTVKEIEKYVFEKLRAEENA